MRALLTGGAGFIGSHVADALLGRGDQVVCLDNFDPFYPRSYKEANLLQARASERFRLVEGDLRDAELVRALLREERPEVVIHLAAKAGVRPSVSDPLGYVSANVEGTMQLLIACRDLGPSKLLLASSSSVYGDETPVPFVEDAPANRPASPYAATKKAVEEIAHALHHVAQLDVVCLRYFTVYGPRQRPEMAVHKFARYLSAGRSLPVYGRGLLQRDYTYVSDAVAGTLSAIDFLLRTRPCFEVFNIGNSRRVRLDELLEMLQAALGLQGQVRHEDGPPGDVKRTWADISKARRLLGYEPKVPIEEGIREFAAWFLAEGGALAAGRRPLAAAPARP
ncbi:MAG: GDP-mannose 4,6-dehydratase [Gemmatimonadota bacterium]